MTYSILIYSPRHLGHHAYNVLVSAFRLIATLVFGGFPDGRGERRNDGPARFDCPDAVTCGSLHPKHRLEKRRGNFGFLAGSS